jgi:site-specific recombinase XerD
MRGGRILSLQKILGHSDLKTILVYAHLSPDFLEGEIDKLDFS